MFTKSAIASTMPHIKTSPKANILVVDDQPSNLLTLSTLLQGENYKVNAVASGATALKTVRSQVSDLILLDIRMPEVNGFEVCAALKRSAQTREIPILFISSSDQVEDKVKAFEVGGSDYITKPFRAEEVLARVKHQLTIQQQRQELTMFYQQVQQLNTQLEQQVQERTQDLHLTLKKLQRLNQLKDDFLSTISHELRTPIANMHVVLQLLMAASCEGEVFVQKLPKSNATTSPASKITQYLNILQEECDRELHLVQDLLDLQYLAAETQPLDLTTIHLDSWIPHVLEALNSSAQKQHQTLTAKLAPNLPLLETDSLSLNRILTELIQNACKYTPPGETITVEVTVDEPEQKARRRGDREIGMSIYNPPSKIVISVSNSGITIPAEELPYIFDKFYRIPTSDPYKHSGIGLGLALVKKLLEHLQGDIDVTSANNLTCFTVKIPNNLRLD